MTPTTTDHIRTACSVAITVLLAAILWTEWPTAAPVTPPGPVTPPSVDLTPIGHDFGVTLVNTYADGLHSGRMATQAGKPMEDIMSAISGTWNAGHTAAFKAKVYPAVTAIVPDGQEPDAAGRARLDAALGQLETGARQVK